MKHISSIRGTVTLVALCLLAVMGIALAGYLAVSNQAMKSSNRMFAKEVSRNLAEMGLEQALRAWQTNNWSTWTSGTTTATWTLSGTTAACTISLSNTQFGRSGITPTIYLRIDRYGSKEWSQTTAYSANDMVWRRGVWFHCTAGNTNNVPPNSSYWVSAPAPWNADANYNISDIVISGGLAYRSTAANTNQQPPNASYWASNVMSTWNAGTTYAVNDLCLLGGTPYRCIVANSGQTPPNLSYWISAPIVYSLGNAALPDSTNVKTLLRASIAPAALFPNAIAASSTVTLASGGTVDSYNSVLGTTGGFSAVIAGANTSSTAISITSATVKGYVAAPSSASTPYAPLASFGAGVAPSLKNPDGSVTSPHPSSSNIDLTRISRSPYVPQFDIQSVSGTITNIPGSTSTIPLAGVTLGTAGQTTTYNVTRTIANAFGSYYSGLYLGDPATVVQINGNVILNVTGSYFGTGSGKFQINSGGSLEIYFSSSTQMYLGNGTGGIDNQTNDPANCFIATTSTQNTVSYHNLFGSGSAMPLCGTIYMPNAFLTIPSAITIKGAVSAKNIRFSSNAMLQYDTTLRTAGSVGSFVDQPYLAVEVRELTDSTERITLP